MTANAATEVDERTVLSRTALAAIAVAFLLIGVIGSAYGPMLGFLTHRFAVTLPIAGGALSAHFAGALVGVLGSMRVMERFPNRHMLVGGLGALGLGCALVALAPTWPVLLAAVFVVGVGFGALDIGLNQLVAHSAGARRAAALNLLNGSFGIGAVLGPILVTVLGQHHFTLLYVGAAVLAIALIPEALRIPGRLPVVSRATAGRPNALVLIFVLAFALYVGTEAGVGGWAPSHLESVGVSAASAAALTSGFWLALGLGRLLVAVLPSRIPEWAIVTTASALGALALLAAVSGRAAPIAYVVAGLAIAPIFPTGVVWLAKLLPGDARATSWLFPGAMLGGALIPAAIGVVVARASLGGVPVVLTAVALGSFLAFASARLVSSRQTNR
jgi:MFS transporter, FHS family, glucose/mannose:H+ symporter